MHPSSDVTEVLTERQQGQLDEAITKLETALLTRADAATYFTFADVLARKGELTTDLPSESQLVRRAIAYYREALRVDWDGQLESKINKALSALQSPGAR
jgi:tetratricopeptide (TPR) repeat protein